MYTNFVINYNILQKIKKDYMIENFYSQFRLKVSKNAFWKKNLYLIKLFLCYNVKCKF